jgi:hypothetical protein
VDDRDDAGNALGDGGVAALLPLVRTKPHLRRVGYRSHLTPSSTVDRCRYAVDRRCCDVPDCVCFFDRSVVGSFVSFVASIDRCSVALNEIGAKGIASLAS